MIFTRAKLHGAYSIILSAYSPNSHLAKTRWHSEFAGGRKPRFVSSRICLAPSFITFSFPGIGRNQDDLNQVVLSSNKDDLQNALQRCKIPTRRLNRHAANFNTEYHSCQHKNSGNTIVFPWIS
jgi:hypothetical protein